MIELRHLRYFIAVAEERNFNRAAERVHIDQTPLARTVRDLEAQLGVVLLERAPRQLRLTPAGHALLRHARGLFTRIDRVQRVVRARDAARPTSLHVGIAEGLAQPRLAACLAAWRDASSGPALHLREMPAAELVQALRQEELDAAFSLGLPRLAGVVQRPLWRHAARALLPREHVLAVRRELSLGELLAFPLIGVMPGRLPGWHRQLEMILRQHVGRPVIAGEAASLSGYLTAVAAGQGVGLADEGFLRMLHRPDLVAVPLLEDVHFVTCLLHKQRPLRDGEGRQRLLTHALSWADGEGG